MAAAARAQSTWEAARVFFRPSRSASIPEGISPHRLTIWKKPSARPISTGEKPRTASSATQAVPAR